MAGKKSVSGTMPVVYFLVTGKSTDIMLHVGATSIGGDILVLDMLKEEHVREVRLHLQDGKKHAFPLQVMGLVGELALFGCVFAERLDCFSTRCARSTVFASMKM